MTICQVRIEVNLTEKHYWRNYIEEWLYDSNKPSLGLDSARRPRGS